MMDPCSQFTAGVGLMSEKTMLFHGGYILNYFSLVIAFREQRLLTEDRKDVADCKVLTEKMESIQNMCLT